MHKTRAYKFIMAGAPGATGFPKPYQKVAQLNGRRNARCHARCHQFFELNCTRIRQILGTCFTCLKNKQILTITHLSGACG